MKNKTDDLSRTMQLGEELAIYVLQLKQNLHRLQHANLWDRNPYWRTKKAKENMKTLEENIEQCVVSILHYTATLAKQGIANQKELNVFFFTYAFLFEFHDGIKKQELEHRILTKDVEITSKFYRFIEQSEFFIKDHNQKIRNLYQT